MEQAQNYEQKRNMQMKFVLAKTILSSYKENHSWFGNNHNMNLYRGCSHGCIYCDSRSSCYQVDDFDEVRGKENALETLENEMRIRKKKGVIGLGAMSDSYNPMEKKYQITRGALKLINRYGFGVSIATKSDLITRDIDLFQQIQKHSPVLIKISITASNDQLSRAIEQRVSLSSERFAAIKTLSDAGIFVGVLMMPILPFIEDTDENILGIAQQAYENKAQFIFPGFGVTLRENQRTWFLNKLSIEFPELREKYIEIYGNQYSCGSPRNKHLWEIFSKECKKLGIIYKMKDIIYAYKKEYEKQQLKFF